MEHRSFDENFTYSLSIAPVQFSNEVLIHTIILTLYNVQFNIFTYFPGKNTIRNNLDICCLHFPTLQLFVLIRFYNTNQQPNAKHRLDTNILRMYRGAKTHIYNFIIWLNCNQYKRYVSVMPMNTGRHHQMLSIHIPQLEMLISRGLSYSLIKNNLQT